MADDKSKGTSQSGNTGRGGRRESGTEKTGDTGRDPKHGKNS